ncbi:transglycosylase SLT domain-containing protein [Vibrio cholerae]|nr:transglycosylase SLT domain-containing protein [Vibrio cholerae]EKF9842518.1 transglycosylase SLT domain-containing protein [Vibrio cholerae]
MRFAKKAISSVVLLIAFPSFAIDCDKYWEYYDGAGKQFNIDPFLLKAVCTKESQETPGAVNKKNRDMSIDYGACQINSFWTDLFENKFSVPMKEVEQSARTSIFAGAYVLAYNFNLKGKNLNSLGAYNVGWRNEDQKVRDRYAREVIQLRNKIAAKCRKDKG